MASAQPDINADIQAINSIDSIDSILEVICRTTGMGFAVVARVTEDKWVACAVRDQINFGLGVGGELDLKTTICYEVSQLHKVIAFDHAAEDPQFCDHHTPRIYGLQSYIAFPIITRKGKFFGTLCAIDPAPHAVNNAETIGTFKLFADLIAFHLHSIEELAISEAKLAEERETAALRDKFIAVLGHDLRNPIGAVTNVAQMLLRMPVDDRVKKLALIVQNSGFRMKSLIDNILDFARGHLGEGIKLSINEDDSLEAILNQVVTELRVNWPGYEINVVYKLARPASCDVMRVAQLLSNLLANAITHGKKNAPINVVIECDEHGFMLSVSNEGNKIPEEVAERLFEPFYRGSHQKPTEGLGLGLYISSEIAKAHGGALSVESTDQYTSFIFTINTAQM